MVSNYFPPVWSLTIRIYAGVITSLLFFASVILHELMHSIVALRHGVAVRSITLFIFGGVAEIAEESKKASDEFVMALVGPLTNLILGIFLIGFWLCSYEIGAGEFIGIVAYWLGVINISLAVCNLIPGFPLDGGRMLRSIAWGCSGDLRRATRIASIVGRVVAYGFIVIGVCIFITGHWFNGIWLVFLGWFLANTATGSYHQVQLNGLLSGHRVKEAMTHGCVTLSPNLEMERLIQEYVLPYGQQCFAVMQGDRLEGIVLLHSLRAMACDKYTVAQMMTPIDKLKWVSPDDELVKALSIMREHELSQIPVMDDGRVVGVINFEILQAFIDLYANFKK